MREIKFRAWDKVCREMFYNSELANGDMMVICLDGEIQLSDYDTYKTNDFILMQYTGLKDKNGKEIYEGDILDTDLERPYLVVEFRNGCFVVECRDDNEKYYDIMHPLEKEISNLEYHEVIGNTYENPELLR